MDITDRDDGRNHEHPYRFVREVNADSPKPGHHLATFSFRLGEERFIMWMVEGPENDTLSFRGMASNFDLTRYFRARISGSAVEALNDLPYHPDKLRSRLDIDITGAGLVHPTAADIVFSTIRAPSGVDPDAAMVRFTIDKERTLDVTVTELRRAWAPLLVVGGCSMALAGYDTASVADTVFGMQVTLVEEKIQVSGQFTVEGGIRSTVRI